MKYSFKITENVNVAIPFKYILAIPNVISLFSKPPIDANEHEHQNISELHQLSPKLHKQKQKIVSTSLYICDVNIYFLLLAIIFNSAYEAAGWID